MANYRTYHDPLHGAITLRFDDGVEALLIRLIDAPEFQRLRRIRQLGTASLTFHGAEGSRFTHSLGAMYVARKAFDQLCDRHPSLKPYRTVVLCGALLHDLGHGPFSHTAEDIFRTHHEGWTGKIIQGSPVISGLLNEADPELVQHLKLIYRKQFPVPLVSQLITSQLDCDRLDYLMRDSYFTGASYGHLDLDRILLAMDYDPTSQELVVAQKGLASIEHYLIVRYFMYAQVYNHSKNMAAAWGLKQVFVRAAELLKQGQLATDSTVQAWLTAPEALTLKDYLAADDGVFNYHLQRWCDHPDQILQDLSRRCRDRDLLKCRDISDRTTEKQTQLLAEIRNQVAAAGLEPNYYSTLETSMMRGYTLYQRGIKVKVGRELQDISEISSLVKSLTQPRQRVWLIYPREIGDFE
jgi:uncharacterized protein